MRLLSIGNSPQSNIVVSGQFVSRNHAELIQLDNGDMLIVDKGSSNGTFVNGNRIAPETEVAVTTRDVIQLADQTLNWSMVPPMPQVDTNVRALKSIGSHYRNTIRLQSPQVSRFHATIKQLKNGKWFICDHSSNGTTLNGQRIPRDQYVPLKKKDVIACAGVSVVNPVTGVGGSSVVKGLLLSLCVCMFIGLCAWGVYELVNRPKNMAASTVMIETFYYYRAHVDILGESIEGRFGLNDKNEPVPIGSRGANMIGARSTGFFIKEDGTFVTNKHVAEPWEHSDKMVVDAIKKRIIANFYKQTEGRHIISASDVQVDGVLHSIAVVPNGYLYDDSNKIPARLLITSDNVGVDLAIMQTLSKELPKGATFIPMSAISDSDVEQGTDILSWGFPIPDELQDVDKWERFIQRDLQAVLADGKITQVDKYNYLHNADSFHGASGSPVFRARDNKLIGVIVGGKGWVNYNNCVKSKYILRLYKKWYDDNH